MKQKLIDFFRANCKWFIFFIAIACLLFLIEDVLDQDIMELDEKGYSFVSKYLISDTMTPIAKCITNQANTYWLIGLSVVLLLVIKNKKIGASIVANLGLSAFVNFTLKQILQRSRPIEHRIIQESGYSFPSGHSMVSMAFYGYLIYLIYKHIKNKYLKILLISLLSLLIINIGTSRIYLGVHYTSDVLAGFLVAIAYLVVYVHAVNKLLDSGTGTQTKKGRPRV